MGLKIAIAGKGGVGKTTISALLARELSLNDKVIAIDADPDSNLATSLGVPQHVREKIKPISEMYELIEERTGARPGSSYGALFNLNPEVEDILDNYGIKLGNISLLVLGTIKPPESGCFCPENALLKALLRHLILERNEHLILDMEAGIEHLTRGTTKGVDYLIIVTEQSWNSFDTTKRIFNLAKEMGVKNIALVLNKVKHLSLEFLKEIDSLGIKLLGKIFWDQEIESSDLGQGIKASKATLQEIKRIADMLKENV